MQTIYWLIALFMAALLGSAFGYQLRKMWAVKRKDTVETKVEALINEAKAKQKELLLEANDKALKIIEDAKAEEKERAQDLARAQKRLENRETLFDQKLLDLENKKQELLDKAERIEKAKTEIAEIREQQLKKLEKVAGLTKEEAKKVLLDNTEREMQEELVARIKKLQNQAAVEVERKARDIIALAMQRCAVSHAAEGSTSTIDLPSDEMKGRIIGREGRNIRTIERLTGTEIIVDDTPQAITVSGFSPIRRQVAKKALERLISDGRIHPAKIEEAIYQAKK